MVIAAPVVTPSGVTNTFTIGGTPVAVDTGVTVSSFDTYLTGATVTITNYQPGDTLHFHPQGGIIIASNTGGVLTLSPSLRAVPTPAEYQAALESITFSTTSNVTTTRSLSIVVDDSLASPTASNTAAESVNVAFSAPVVTPSGSAASYTAGGSPVAVDPGVTVASLRHRSEQRYGHDLRRHAAVGRYAQFHQSKRHQRQLRRRRADLDRQRYAGPIHGGLAVGYVLLDQYQHNDSGDFNRCR